MSLLGELAPSLGAVKKRKRVGRGHGSGWGKTSAKGHKGQKARSGGKVRRGFEGGQTPLARRLPKLGFTNAAFRNRYETISLDQLNRFEGEITPAVLNESRLVKGAKIKVLANGKLEKSLVIKGIKLTKGAKSAVEAAGGRVVEL